MSTEATREREAPTDDEVAWGGWSPTSHLADLLVEYRRNSGLSRAGAAVLIDVTDSAWAGWEQGRVPTPQNLVRLGRLLDTEHATLRAMAGPDRVRKNVPTVTRECNLTSLRFAAGLTSSALARAMHVSLALVSRWESGDRVPRRDYWPALAEAIKVDITVISDLFAERRAPSDTVSCAGLREARQRVNATQAYVARAMKVDVSSIQRWERSGQMPHAVVAALACFLGVTEESLSAAPLVPASSALERPSALRLLRRTRRLPAGVLATRMDVSPSAIWAWERGKSPSWTHARELARHLDVSTSDLFALVGLSKPQVLRRDGWTTDDFPLVMRELRRWNGLRQVDVATLLAVKPSTVYAWERGRHMPRTRSLQELDLLFGTERFSRIPRRKVVKDGKPLTRASQAAA